MELRKKLFAIYVYVGIPGHVENTRKNFQTNASSKNFDGQLYCFQICGAFLNVFCPQRSAVISSVMGNFSTNHQNCQV